MKKLLKNVLPKALWRVLANTYYGTKVAVSKTFSNERANIGSGVIPFSQVWGIDRGEPLHRYYLEQFLSEQAVHIKGHCLEFQEDRYTTELGGKHVNRVDVISNLPGNPKATLLADITLANNLQDNTFDCIICTHVLHLIFEVERAIIDLHRILKPGGVLLVGSPMLNMYEPEWLEYWRFTELGMLKLLEKHFGAGQVQAESYGNSLIAAGELRGLVRHEFTQQEIDYRDKRFAVEVCAVAVKQSD